MLHSKNTQVVLQPYHSYTPPIHSKLFRLWFLRSLAYYHMPTIICLSPLNLTDKSYKS